MIFNNAVQPINIYQVVSSKLIVNYFLSRDASYNNNIVRRTCVCVRVVTHKYVHRADLKDGSLQRENNVFSLTTSVYIILSSR